MRPHGQIECRRPAPGRASNQSASSASGPTSRHAARGIRPLCAGRAAGTGGVRVCVRLVEYADEGGLSRVALPGGMLVWAVCFLKLILTGNQSARDAPHRAPLPRVVDGCKERHDSPIRTDGPHRASVRTRERCTPAASRIFCITTRARALIRVAVASTGTTPTAVRGAAFSPGVSELVPVTSCIVATRASSTASAPEVDGPPARRRRYWPFAASPTSVSHRRGRRSASAQPEGRRRVHPV